eukprot:jgi/Orpsp1_1/1185898/evm.model.c7180000095907.1
MMFPHLAVSANQIVASLLGLLGIGSLSMSSYRKQFEALNYGTKVEVDGLSMSVNIAGEQNNQTIVLIPGLGVAVPYISYKSFTDPLSHDYKVITVEPFGYGLSDDTRKERTNENMTNELHTCLKKLGVDKFYLMAHSISGIYSLAYANKYPEDVLGFIGLDNTPRLKNFEEIMTPPSKEEIIGGAVNRILIKNRFGRFDTDEFISNFTVIDPHYDFTKEDMKNYEVAFSYTFSSETVINESENMNENILAAKDLTFKCPALMFMSSEFCEHNPNWRVGHNDTVGNPEKSEIYELEGSHAIYIDQKDFILKKIKEWMKKIN